MLISLTHPLTPEVTFDPKLPIRPVTFDLKPEVPTTSTDEFKGTSHDSIFQFSLFSTLADIFAV